MEKQNAVFLFGAGATIAWGAPYTSDLTELVRTSGFYTLDNKTRITEYIYQRLLDNGFAEKDVNFETIISVIEELIVYYSDFDSSNQTPSITRCFLESKVEKDIFNFSIRGGERVHGFQIDVPAGKEYLMSKRALNHETPKQFFLMHLLGLLLTEISDRISDYAYQTEGHSVIDDTSSISKSFCAWMTDLSETNVLKLYTLNYERLFKILLERKGIRLFEGFDAGENVEIGKILRADIPKILNESTCNVHYNLHGSAFWDVRNLDDNQLSNPELVLNYGLVLPVNNDPAMLQVEKGKSLLVSNIITGYQKSQRSMLSPFKQMQFAFDRDCCNANRIYIVGYSFGDEHINQAIKIAIRFNENVQIIIIDPSFDEKKMDELLLFNFFSFKNSGLNNLKPKKVVKNIYSYFENSFIVFNQTFSEFLEMAMNPEFIFMEKRMLNRIAKR